MFAKANISIEKATHKLRWENFITGHGHWT